jgi:hypothetical protein
MEMEMATPKYPQLSMEIFIIVDKEYNQGYQLKEVMVK